VLITKDNRCLAGSHALTPTGTPQDKWGPPPHSTDDRSPYPNESAPAQHLRLP